jgi:hypothetical protein
MTFSHRFLAALLIAGSGGLVCWQIFQSLDGGLPIFACAGALLSGLMVAQLFGLPGIKGAVLAILGAVLATAGGAALAGIILGIPMEEPGLTFAAPMFVASAIASSPFTAVTWAATLGAAHLILLWVRRYDVTP